MKYKLIGADFDNTIAGRDCVISDYTKKVVAEYTARGGKFILNTGRIFEASKRFALQLGLKGELVAFQGAAVYDIESGRILYSDAIDKQTAIDVLKEFEKINYIVVHGYAADGYYVEKANPVTSQYDIFCGIKAGILNGKVSTYFKETGKECLKIVAFVPSEEIDGFVAFINEKYGDTVFAMKSQATYLEVTNKCTSKGLAIKFLAEKYGINREDIMCFGDATNDISMIKYAGMGVAVGNAMQEVKDAADYVCEPVTENGMAKTIVKFCLDGKDV